jgi:hypothetical protein
MVCGNLFPCRVQIPQWPRNDEMATRNRHVHVLGQVHRVRCNDASASRNLQAKASAQVRPQQLVANAGYGAECVHELCRERWRVNSWIPWQRLVGTVNRCNDPPLERPWSSDPPAASASANEVAASGRNGRVRGRWRFPMREMPKVYRSRCQAESLLSELK